jgi:heat shock protein HslJ
MYNLPEAADSRHVKGRGNGYLLDLGEQRVYIAGDTAGIPEMRALTGVDIALIPMNGPTMPVEEAADAVLEFAPRKVMPYHYRSGTALSDVAKFKQLVKAGGKDIVVEQLDWYPVAPESLLQGEWTWVSSTLKDNVTVTPKQADAFTISFGTDGSLNGGTDCNSYFGQFHATEGKFALTGPIGATKKFCEGSQESVYWGQLEDVESFASAFNGNLTLTLKDGEGTMTFKRNE